MPGRAMTLLEYCKLDNKVIDYIAEQKTSLKIGLYTPGTKIPVKDEKMHLNHHQIMELCFHGIMQKYN